MFESLNPQQKEAVMHDNGPLLVFAGAGSGKTRVITSRIARLINDGVAIPENILAVTFTRKAAGEMKERIASILSQLGNDKPKRMPYVGTFHALGANILRMDGVRAGLPMNFSIYDPEDCISLIKQIMNDQNIDKKQFNPNAIFHLISSAKNEGIAADQYFRYAGGPIEDVVAEVYPEYEKLLKQQAAVDFDDLQILPLKIFDDEKTLKKYNDKFKYILVDEYQDTNMIQYNLIRKLAGENNNVCVVGDDDQGIYSWRGATIKNILRFEKDFPGAKVVKLEKNYRSTKNILHAAYSVISQNEERAEKQLWTDTGDGKKIIVYQARDDRDEAQFVIDNIRQKELDGKPLGEMAVLYRINAQSRVIEEELLRSAIPYRLVGGVRFYERREIKDMLGYLRFLSNPQDQVSFSRIINVPPRKIGEKTIQEINQFTRRFTNNSMESGLFLLLLWGSLVDSTNLSEYLPGVEIPETLWQKVNAGLDPDLQAFKDKHASIISLFGSLYDYSKKENVRLLIDEILDTTRYEKWIDDGSEQAESRKENLFELKNVATKYSQQGPRDSLLSFLSDVALVEQDQEVDIQDPNEAVTLMTVHGAKGLEFDTVFLVGLEEGFLPHSRAFTSTSELEEERRLCYVGITRAKKELLLSYAESRRTYGSSSERIPSRFISEIPTDILEFYSWDSYSSY